MSHAGALIVAHMPRSAHDDRLATLDVSDAVVGAAMGPFLFVSLYAMHGPVFPPHPHAGFTVATNMLPESPIGFLNRDSLGHRNRIAPGALHVTLAGSGVLHEEHPEHPGGLARGFQIWLDHADGDRERSPVASHLAAEDVPRRHIDGHAVRVVAGRFSAVHSPIELASPARILDLELVEGDPLVLPLDADELAFVVVHGGSLRVGESAVEAGQVAATRFPGQALSLRATQGSARATLFAGPAVTARRVRHGPFVASDAAQMQRFIARYQAGHFGTLRPFTADAKGASIGTNGGAAGLGQR